jgi:hypothetical protein
MFTGNIPNIFLILPPIYLITHTTLYKFLDHHFCRYLWYRGFIMGFFTVIMVSEYSTPPKAI